jgi:general secretion pathway protein D
LSLNNSNPKRHWFRQILRVGAQKSIWWAPAVLCPLAITGVSPDLAYGQTVATRSITDAPAVDVNAEYVVGWLNHAHSMASSDRLQEATAAFAEALRGRKQLGSAEPSVEQRVREVANLLAEKKVTPAQVSAAASALGVPRPVPVAATSAGMPSSAGMPAFAEMPAFAGMPASAGMNAAMGMNASQPGGVVTAQTGAQSQASTVAPGLFRPEGDSTVLQQASTQGQLAVGTASPGTSGDELYQQGIELLSQGKRQDALEAFRRAWEHQGEMDPAIRNALKDKLSSLQASMLSAEAVAAQPLSPEEQSQLQERQRWISEVTGELSDAKSFRESEPLLVAERLQILRTRVSQADLSGETRQRLLTLVDRAITEHQLFISQNRSSIDQNTRNRQVKEQIALDSEQRYKIDQQIASLVETYNDLMDKGEFMQAEVVAKQVGALDPNSTIASLLIARARNARRIGEYEEIRTMKEDGFVDAMLDIDRSSQPVSDEDSYQFPKGWEDLSRRRLADSQRESQRGMSPAEARIWEQLKQPVLVNFNQRPLHEVVRTLSDMSGIMIHLDERGLAQEGVPTDDLVTLDLPSQITLRSALTLMLNTRNLDFQVANEVLTITSVRNTAQANRVVTYSVKDLVVPIPNFITDYNSGMAGALRNAYETINNGLVARTQQRFGGMGETQLASGSLNPDSGALGQLAGNMPPGIGGGVGPGMIGPGMMRPGMMGPGGMMSGFGSMGPTVGGPPLISMGSPSAIGGGAAMADFGSLMNLIQQTIDPDNWLANGGQSSMIPFANNLSLVISAPQTTHEKISDLLDTLRRLQDLQVTIEVKFITLNDNFFERMGIDFDVRIEDGYRSPPLSERQKSKIVLGISQGSTPTNPFPFTADLDIAFDQNNFSAAVPQFGGFQDGLGGSIGFAILSQLEMFFFMNAAQGDSRSNVLQAPRVTMFDGQFASINDTVQRPFVTSLIPVVGDFAVAQQPVIVVLNEGTILNVQSTISQDKRFVRLTLNPTFSQIDRVDTFTFEGTRTSSNTSRRTGQNLLNPDEGELDEAEDTEDTVISGTTVQQPSFATTSISTTVSVPDGGTILLGGIKRMRESRIERGVPVLSKIPYLNRLFKNTAIGRESSTLMMTVTPRIIIQEEEEQKYGVFP